MPRLHDLPSPPPGKAGFPWNEESTASFDSRMDYPRISIVTPSYNQGNFLEATIRSVLLQNYPNLEYIVIDGESTDDSRTIIEEYGDFLAYWVSEPDQGQANAINKGLERSTGAIMSYLNSDDILLPNALYHITHAYMNDLSLIASCGFRKLIDSDGNFTGNMIRGIPGRYQERYRNVIAQETTYWRREVWEKIGALDESKRFAMDYEYWQRMLAAGYEIRLLPYYLGGYRWHDESKTATLDELRKQELTEIYQHYDIAADEESAYRQIGHLWTLRYNLAKDLSHQTVFKNPRVALRILRLLESPLSPPLLYAYAIYRKLRGR